MNLNAVKVSKILTVKMEGRRLSVRSNFGIRKIESVFPKAARVSPQEFAARADTLRDTDWIARGRGKYLLDFYVRVIHHLADDSNKPHPKLFKKRTTIRFQYTVANALESLTAFADTPPSLGAFLSTLSPAVDPPEQGGEALG